MTLAGLVAAAILMKPTASELVLGSWMRPMVVGHRGAAGLAPENTLIAFDKGISAGAGAVECDVQMSLDGVPVIMHDATVDRTTTGSGRVDSKTAAELQSLGVPTLASLMDHLQDRTTLIIELKEGKGLANAVVKEVQSRHARDRVMIFSFKDELISDVERIDPSLYTVFLSSVAYGEHAIPALLDRLSQINADAVGFQHLNLHPALVDALRAEQIPVFAWTVPPGNEVERLRGLGVNFIITDFPDQVRRQLDELAANPPVLILPEETGLESILPLME